jgi:hypothetical protein
VSSQVRVLSSRFSVLSKTGSSENWELRTGNCF